MLLFLCNFAVWYNMQKNTSKCCIFMELLLKVEVYCFGNYCIMEENNWNLNTNTEVSICRDYKRGFCQYWRKSKAVVMAGVLWKHWIDGKKNCWNNADFPIAIDTCSLVALRFSFFFFLDTSSRPVNVVL